MRGPVGVPKGGKAPLDQFFGSVGKGTILSKKPPPKPKPPPSAPPPKPKAPKLGPYSKPVPYKPGKTYAPGTPVRFHGQTILQAGPKPSPPPKGPKAVKATTPAKRVGFSGKELRTLAGGQRGTERFLGVSHAQAQAIRRESRAAAQQTLIPSHQNILAASNALVGPQITRAVGERSLTPLYHHPLEGGLELAGLIPGLGRIARPIEAGVEAGRALRAGEELGTAGRRAGSVLRRGVTGTRDIHIGGGERITAKRSPEIIPRTLETIKDLNLRHVLGQNEALGKGRGLEGRSFSARMAQRHVEQLKRTSKFYGNVWDRHEAEMLLDAPISDVQHTVLGQVSKGVMPHVTIARNEKLIADAKRTLESTRGKIGDIKAATTRTQKVKRGVVRAAQDVGTKAAGVKRSAALQELTLRERQALRDIEDLTTKNVWLRKAEAYMHEVPVGDMTAAERERFPVHPDHVGTKAILKPATDKDTRLMHGVWDIYRSVNQKSEAMALREEVAAAREAGGTDEEIAQRVEGVHQKFENRIHQPGRIEHGGAKWGPGEEFLSPAHQKVRQQVVRLQKRLDKAMEQDAKRVAKGSVPRQGTGFEGAMATKTRNIRGALNDAENRLTKLQAADRKRLGYDPARLYDRKRGMQGAEDWKGGTLYYPSKTPAALEGGPKAPYTTRSDVLPFEPQAEPKKPYTGYNLETGRESHRVAQLVGRQYLARHTRENLINELQGLRHQAITHEMPTDPRDPTKIHPEYHAIRTTRTVPAHLNQDFKAAQASLASGKDLTDEEASQIAKAYTDLSDFLLPKGTVPVGEGIGYVHKSLVKHLLDTRKMTGRDVQEWTKWLHNASQVTRDLMIYTKLPGHIPPRLASNVIMPWVDMGVIHGGKDLIKGGKAAVQLHRDDPLMSRQIVQLTGKGSTRGYTDVTGAVSKGVKGLSHALVTPIELAADRGPRLSTFMAYAYRESGAKNYQELKPWLNKMFDAKPGDALYTKRRLMLEDVRKSAGEYENLGPNAKAIANYVFLARWLLASGRWTTRAVAKHPLQAAALGTLIVKYGYNAKNPVWNRFNILGHNVQTAMPWSTPWEIGSQTVNALGRGKLGLGESLLGNLNPLALNIMAALTGHDPETGRDIPNVPIPVAGRLAGALEGFGRGTPIGALAAGKGPFVDYRLLKFLLGNYAPASGPAGPVSGGGGGGDFKLGPGGSVGGVTVPGVSYGGGVTLPGVTLDGSTVAGTITPHQHKQIMKHLTRGKRR
jgi:hypothetical protein